VTLIELLIGIAILGILAAIAVPSYNEFIANTQIRTTTESIRNGLQVARAEAIKRNATVTFTLNNNTSWVVGCATATANCPATIQSKAAREGGSDAVSVAITGTNPVAFNSFGNAVAGDFIVNVDSSTIAAAKSKDSRVRVGTGGYIRVCDPNVSATTDTRFCAT
jgi:type IV fimbrial biogenesis protein FimT